MAKASKAAPSTREAGEQLKSDFETLLKDAQRLVGALGGDLDEKTNEAKERLLETLEHTKERYHDADERLRALATEGIERTDQVVHSYPYHAMGITFGFGFLIGLLLRKK